MNQDKELLHLQKEFLAQNRQSIRDKLKERRKQVDHMHLNAGQPVVKNVEGNQFENAVKQYRDSQMIEVRLSSPRTNESHIKSSATSENGFHRTITMNFGAKSTIDSQRLQYLAKPKEEYEPTNVFKHQEFRGLLHADN